MIKNIKLMLVAALAMLSMNSFATFNLTTGAQQTIGGITYKVLSVYNTENATAGKVNTVSAEQNNFTGTEIVIPATVQIAVEGTDDEFKAIKKNATFKVVKIVENGFKGLSKVTSVSIGANVSEIEEGAFAGTSITSLDLTGTQVKTINKWFVSTATPAVSSNGTLASVTLPTTAETIAENAFNNCTALSSLNVPANSHLTQINGGAFYRTSLQTLDLSNAWYKNASNAVVGMTTFGNGIACPFTDGTKNNGVIKSVILPNTCTTVAANAFKDCTRLSEIDLTKVSTVGANAFEGCIKLTSVAIGTGLASKVYVASVAAEAFKGCTALASVELGKLKSAVVVNNAFEGCGALATFTFNEIDGESAVGTDGTGSPYDLASVITVNFKKYITAANAVAAGAFASNAFKAIGKKYNIYYNEITLPANGSYVQPFVQDAFGSNETDPRDITLTTQLAFFEASSGFATNANALYRVTIEAGYTTDVIIGNASQKLLKDKNSSYYYYYYAPTGKYKIAKKSKAGAEIKVYQAYADEADAAIYYMPLVAKNGYFVIEGVANNITTAPNNIPFIIKSSTEDGVLAEVTTDDNTMIKSGSAYVNSLIFSGNKSYSLFEILSDDDGFFGASTNNDIYYLANPTTAGFGFAKFDTETMTAIGKNTLFLSTASHPAAARLKNIWLDEEGNVTAIDGVESKPVVNNGAIYNLAGQQVDGSYKGVVIKNGKKMIQK